MEADSTMWTGTDPLESVAGVGASRRVGHGRHLAQMDTLCSRTSTPCLKEILTVVRSTSDPLDKIGGSVPLCSFSFAPLEGKRGSVRQTRHPHTVRVNSTSVSIYCPKLQIAILDLKSGRSVKVESDNRDSLPVHGVPSLPIDEFSVPEPTLSLYRNSSAKDETVRTPLGQVGRILRNGHGI